MMTEKEIHDICKKYYIRNYKINPDGSIDVLGNVGLSSNELTELPLKFNIVEGFFLCNDNKITSLKNFPISVYGIYCSNNKLTSLEGCPKEVGGNFYCYNNPLESLEGYDGEYHKIFCTNKKKLIRKEKIRIINNI